MPVPREAILVRGARSIFVFDAHGRSFGEIDAKGHLRRIATVATARTDLGSEAAYDAKSETVLTFGYAGLSRLQSDGTRFELLGDLASLPNDFVNDSRLGEHPGAVAFHVHDAKAYFALQSTLFVFDGERVDVVAGKRPKARPVITSTSQLLPINAGDFVPGLPRASVPAQPPKAVPPPAPLECVQTIVSDGHALVLLERNRAVRRLDPKKKTLETLAGPDPSGEPKCEDWETPAFVHDGSLHLPSAHLRFDLNVRAWRAETRLGAIEDAKSFAVDERGDIWAALEGVILKVDGKSFGTLLELRSPER